MILFEQAGHHEGLLVEHEDGQCNADHQRKHDEKGRETVSEKFNHQFVLTNDVSSSNKLHQGQYGFIGIHTGDHGQQGGK